MKGLARILIQLFSLSLIIFLASCPNPVSSSGGGSSGGGGGGGSSGGGDDTNEAPIVDIISPDIDVIIDEGFLPVDASLDATVSEVDPYTVLWTIADGPDASVDFADATSEDTVATFHNAGIYTLRLTADDGELTHSADVTIRINEPDNLAPSVNAGDDDMLNVAVLPPFDATYDLNPTVNYNGNPPFPDTALWNLENGPAEVIFDDDSTLNTIVHFSTYGIYELKLVVSDGLLDGEDTVLITVNKEGNGVPTVNAGDDQIIWMPGTDTVDLSSADAADDGVPDPPGTLTTTWSKQSGPGSVTFVDANIVDTTATFSECGIYVLRLTATDSVLEIYDEVQITVDWTGNVAPDINAGANQIITLPDNTASLSANCTDDALPAAATYIWTKQSGPGDVSFVDANSLNTDVSFSAGGEYVLRITASDAIYTVFDELSVVVNFSPEVNAGDDENYVQFSNYNAPLDGTVDDDGLPDPPGSLTTTWTKTSGPGNVTFDDANAIDTTAYFTLAGTYALRLTADDGAAINYDEVTISVSQQANDPPDVDAGTDQIVRNTLTASLDGTVTDDGNPDPPAAVTTTWSRQSGSGTANFNNANSVDTDVTFSAAGTYVLRLTANDGAGDVYDEVTITAHNSPSCNAGVDQIVNDTLTADLDGTVSDDGHPDPPGALTTTWNKLSGPGSVSFGNANAVDTTATFSVVGEYVLRLSADDGDAVTQDNVTIVAHNSPSCDAGSNQVITDTLVANLDGTVTDDNLPDPPGAVTTTWDTFSGPGTVDFGDENAVDTTATFSVVGEYVLRLSANDGDTITTDTVTITAHNSPQVSAGPDSDIVFPDSAFLDGDVTDDAIPVAATITWSMISGPGNVAFGDANAVDTTADFSALGTYLLRITANDGYGSDTDDMFVTVVSKFRVDIGATGQTVQSGWVAMTNTTTLSNQSAEFDTDFSIGIGGGGPSIGFANNPNMGGEYTDVFCDGRYRTGNMTLSIQNLDAGDYKITLYSADTSIASGTNTINVRITDSTRTAVDVGVETTVGYNELANAQVLDSGPIAFTANGIDDVVVTFNSSDQVYLCGFILETN